MANAEITLSTQNPSNEVLKQLVERIDNLESRHLFQEDTIEQLSHEISVHQHKIAELKQQLQLVANRIKDSASVSGDKDEVEPPPPHF